MTADVHAHPALFTPWKLNELPIANRTVVAPMTRISATIAGLPTETMARYYQRFARGGFGLIVSEGIYTDQAYSQGYACQPGLSDLVQAKGWQPVVNAVHAAGGKIFAQLMHAGALAQGNRFSHETIAPSAVQPKGAQMALYRGEGRYLAPRAMSEEEIGEAIDGFARAASFAVHVAGFDGVEIHGANGYLIDQFLTDYTNRRSDTWGGAIGCRLRLSVEVAHAVRKALGHAVPVGMRISQGKVNDFTHKWGEAETGAIAVFGALADAGLDYIHVTEFEAWRPAFGEGGKTLARLARDSAPQLAIIANGGLHDPLRAEEVLRDGADMVAIGRGALANPAWPIQVRNGVPLRKFDAALLSPLGNVKAVELQEPYEATC